MAKGFAPMTTCEGMMAKGQNHRQLAMLCVWLSLTAPMPLGAERANRGYTTGKLAAGTAGKLALSMASEITTRTRNVRLDAHIV